jgi:hypothetical protein
MSIEHVSGQTEAAFTVASRHLPLNHLPLRIWESGIVRNVY